MLEHMNPTNLLRSIVVTVDRIKNLGGHPGSDEWVADVGGKKDEMVQMVVDAWCDLTEKNRHEFPWREGAVGKLYIAYRKKSAGQKERLRIELFGHADAPFE